jgi:hypothetical protein
VRVTRTCVSVARARCSTRSITSRASRAGST